MNKDKLDIAFEDYHSVQEFIARMDQYIFSIRNLVVATTSGIIAYSIVQNKYLVLFANYILIVCFLFLEYSWKCFQEDAYKRTYLIEDMIQKFLNGNQNSIYPYEFGLGHVLRAPTIRKIVKTIFRKDRWHNIFFYIMIAVINTGVIVLFGIF